MFECEYYRKLIDRYVNDYCSEQESELLHSHVKGCHSCRDELLFNLNIKKALQSLPRPEVPEDFLTSLNKKLDKEERFIPKKSFNPFLWKKYSALAACLLLAVMLRVDIWNISELPSSTEIIIDSNQSENAVASEPLDASSANEAPEVILPDTSESQKTLKKETHISQKPVNTEISLETPNIVSSAVASDSEPPKDAYSAFQNENVSETQNSSFNPSSKVLSMPVVALPAYMDNKDNIIIVPEKSEQIRFDDYEMVVNDELLEAFSLAEMPSNNVIVATPAALSSVQSFSLDNTAPYKASTVNYGAGEGSLFVSESDEAAVQSILDKYSIGAENKTFMLSSSSYNSFISDLENEGINYRDYMINTTKTNVAFTLIIS